MILDSICLSLPDLRKPSRFFVVTNADFLLSHGRAMLRYVDRPQLLYPSATQTWVLKPILYCCFLLLGEKKLANEEGGQCHVLPEVVALAPCGVRGTGGHPRSRVLPSQASWEPKLCFCEVMH